MPYKPCRRTFVIFTALVAFAACAGPSRAVVTAEVDLAGVLTVVSDNCDNIAITFNPGTQIIRVNGNNVGGAKVYEITGINVTAGPCNDFIDLRARVRRLEACESRMVHLGSSVGSPHVDAESDPLLPPELLSCSVPPIRPILPTPSGRFSNP